MEYTEAQINILIKKSKRGDKRAFDRLVEIYQPKVYNFAYKLALNYDDASDITVETFVRVFKSISGFRNEANFSSWMFTIVKNVYYDTLKNIKKNQHQSINQIIQTEDGIIEKEYKDEESNPEETLIEKERFENLIKIINTLPTEQAVAIKLYHLERMGYEQISRILGIPLGTVKSRINRARKNLEEKLTDFGKNK